MVNYYLNLYSSTIITSQRFKKPYNTLYMQLYCLGISDNINSHGLHKSVKSINSFYDGLFPRQISFRRNSLKSFCKSSRHIMHSARSIFNAVSNLHRVSH